MKRVQLILECEPEHTSETRLPVALWLELHHFLVDSYNIL